MVKDTCYAGSNTFESEARNQMTFYLKLYCLTVPIFFSVDMLWLGFIAKDFYQNHLGFLLRPQVNWFAAIIFYLIYIVGILIFGVSPGINTQSWTRALIFGSLYGFFTYATYELTNMALVENWPFKVVIVDILWGIVLCSIVSVSSYFIAKKWLL